MTVRSLPAALPADGRAEAPSAPGRTSHAWRTLLESRWGERLIAVITLSLAYHEAADRQAAGRAGSIGRPDNGRLLRRLMRNTVAARRDLAETEEALARLSDGRFGRCEQCAGAIPPRQLARVPETRYCPRCVRPARTRRSARRPRRPVYWTQAPADWVPQEEQ